MLKYEDLKKEDIAPEELIVIKVYGKYQDSFLVCYAEVTSGKFNCLSYHPLPFIFPSLESAKQYIEEYREYYNVKEECK